jgi:hypothetical protein
LDDIQRENPELTFYYSREHRLSHAPPELRKKYEEGWPPKPLKTGFFKSLTDTTPKKMLFGTIVVMCVVIIFMGYGLPSGLSSGAPRFEGNSITATAVRAVEEDSPVRVYMVIEAKALDAGKTWSGPVEAAVFAESDAAKPLWHKTIVFSGEPKEEFRFAIETEERGLILRLESEAQNVDLKITAK